MLLLTGVISVLCLTDFLRFVDGNALLKPEHRGMVWTRDAFNSAGYNYMGINCGGIATVKRFDGQCGLCGDPYDGPKEHETGGKYATGEIAHIVHRGERTMPVKILLNSNQGGYFEFSLCDSNGAPETQACFDRHLLTVTEGRAQGDEYGYYPNKAGIVKLTIEIPENLACDRCVLQWKYVTGNTWGRDEHGHGCRGCGPQETFINCADISIEGWGTPPPPQTYAPPAPPAPTPAAFGPTYPPPTQPPPQPPPAYQSFGPSAVKQQPLPRQQYFQPPGPAPKPFNNPPPAYGPPPAPQVQPQAPPQPRPQPQQPPLPPQPRPQPQQPPQPHPQPHQPPQQRTQPHQPPQPRPQPQQPPPPRPQPQAQPPPRPGQAKPPAPRPTAYTVASTTIYKHNPNTGGRTRVTDFDEGARRRAAAAAAGNPYPPPPTKGSHFPIASAAKPAPKAPQIPPVAQAAFQPPPIQQRAPVPKAAPAVPAAPAPKKSGPGGGGLNKIPRPPAMASAQISAITNNANVLPHHDPLQKYIQVGNSKIVVSSDYVPPPPKPGAQGQPMPSIPKPMPHNMPPPINGPAPIGGGGPFFQPGPLQVPLNPPMGGPFQPGPPTAPLNPPMGGPFQPPPPPAPHFSPMGGTFDQGPPMANNFGYADMGMSELFGNATDSLLASGPVANQPAMLNEYRGAADPSMDSNRYASSDRATGLQDIGPGHKSGSSAEPWMNEFGNPTNGRYNTNSNAPTNSRYGGAENVKKSSIEQKSSSRYGAASYRSNPEPQQSMDTQRSNIKQEAPVPSMLDVPKNLFQRNENPGFVPPAVKERFTNYEVGGSGEPKITKEEMLRNLNTRNYDVPPSKSTSSVGSDVQPNPTTLTKNDYLVSTEPTMRPGGRMSDIIMPKSKTRPQPNKITNLNSEALNGAYDTSAAADTAADASLTKATSVLDKKIQELKSLSTRLTELQEMLSKQTQITQPVIQSTTLAPTTKTTTTLPTTTTSRTTQKTTTTFTTAATTAAAMPILDDYRSQSYAKKLTGGTQYSSPTSPATDPLNENTIQKLWEMYLKMKPDAPASADTHSNNLVSSPFEQSQSHTGGSMYVADTNQYQDNVQATTQSWLGTLSESYGGSHQSSSSLTGAADYSQQTSNFNTLQSLSELLGGANMGYDATQQLGNPLSSVAAGLETGAAGSAYDAVQSLGGVSTSNTGSGYDTSQHLGSAQGFGSSLDTSALLSQTSLGASGSGFDTANTLSNLASLASSLQSLRSSLNTAQTMPEALSPVIPPFESIQQSQTLESYNQASAAQTGYDPAGQASGNYGSPYDTVTQTVSGTINHSPNGYEYVAQGTTYPSSYNQWQGAGTETQGTGYSGQNTNTGYIDQGSAYDAQGTGYGTYPQESYSNGTTIPPSMPVESSSYIHDLKAKMLRSIKEANSRKSAAKASPTASGVSWQQERWQEITTKKSKGPVSSNMKTAISSIADKLSQSMNSIGQTQNVSLPMTKKSIMAALQNIAAGISKTKSIQKRSSPAPVMREMHENDIKMERIIKPLVDLAVSNATENIKYTTQDRDGLSKQQHNREQFDAIRKRFELLRKLRTIIQVKKAQEALAQQPVRESTPSASDLFPSSSVETMQMADIALHLQQQTELPIQPLETTTASALVEKPNNNRALVLKQLASLLQQRMLKQRLASEAQAQNEQVQAKLPNGTVEVIQILTTNRQYEATTPRQPEPLEVTTEAPPAPADKGDRSAAIARLRRVLKMRKALQKLQKQKQQDEQPQPDQQQPKQVQQKVVTVAEKKVTTRQLTEPLEAAPTEVIAKDKINSNKSVRSSNNVIVMPLNRDMLLRVLQTIRTKQNPSPTS